MPHFLVFHISVIFDDIAGYNYVLTLLAWNSIKKEKICVQVHISDYILEKLEKQIGESLIYLEIGLFYCEMKLENIY